MDYIENLYILLVGIGALVLVLLIGAVVCDWWAFRQMRQDEREWSDYLNELNRNQWRDGV